MKKIMVVLWIALFLALVLGVVLNVVQTYLDVQRGDGMERTVLVGYPFTVCRNMQDAQGVKRNLYCMEGSRVKNIALSFFIIFGFVGNVFFVREVRRAMIARQ